MFCSFSLIIQLQLCHSYYGKLHTCYSWQQGRGLANGQLQTIAPSSKHVWTDSQLRQEVVTLNWQKKEALSFFLFCFFLERWRCESLFNILHNNKPIYFSSALVFSVDAVQKKVHWNFQKKEKKTVKVKLQQLLCHLRRETLNMAWTSNNYKYVQSLMKWSGLSHPQQRISFRPVISEYHSVGKKQE